MKYLLLQQLGFDGGAISLMFAALDATATATSQRFSFAPVCHFPHSPFKKQKSHNS